MYAQWVMLFDIYFNDTTSLYLCQSEMYIAYATAYSAVKKSYNMILYVTVTQEQKTSS